MEQGLTNARTRAARTRAARIGEIFLARKTRIRARAQSSRTIRTKKRLRRICDKKSARALRELCAHVRSRRTFNPRLHLRSEAGASTAPELAARVLNGFASNFAQMSFHGGL